MLGCLGAGGQALHIGHSTSLSTIYPWSRRRIVAGVEQSLMRHLNLLVMCRATKMCFKFNQGDVLDVDNITPVFQRYP